MFWHKTTTTAYTKAQSWLQSVSHSFWNSTSQSKVEKTLHAGKRAERYLRRWIGGAMLLTSFTAGTLGQFLAITNVQLCEDDCLDAGLTWIFMVVSLVTLGLAPLRGDVVLARISIMGMVGVMIVTTYFITLRMWSPNPSDGGWVLDQFAYVTLNASFVIALLFSMSRRGAANVQDCMWYCTRLFFLAELALDSVALTLECRCTCTLFYVPADSIGLLVSALPSLRHRVHSWLIRVVDRRHAKVTAASLAGLIGDCGVQEVVRQATARFRCVQRCQLTKSQLAAKDPDPEAYRLSTSARLGSCDAFISHAWSDDPDSKWEALQQWCDSFVATHGREPTMWIDKCCIDQSDVEADLRCLPIFLGGCREMVVLCGGSFFSRLWCVLEIFTFHFSGLDHSRLTVVPLLGMRQSEDTEVLSKVLVDFDVQQCECSRDADKEKIIELLLAAFGSTREFNKVLREVIRDTDLSHSLSCEWDFDIESPHHAANDVGP